MKLNYKTLFVMMLIIAVGVLALWGSEVWQKWGSVLNGSGTSLVASGIIGIITSIMTERIRSNPLEDWKLKGIYFTRAEMNADCGLTMQGKVKQIDVIAFGLSSFRNTQRERMIEMLKSGTQFRIITMDPESPHVGEREKEEGGVQKLGTTINQMIDDFRELNSRGYKGKIKIKGYTCMTLDFYWRVDNTIYIGPYWYGKPSQYTISYKYVGNSGNGYKLYKGYFDDLWKNDAIMKDILS